MKKTDILNGLVDGYQINYCGNVINVTNVTKCYKMLQITQLFFLPCNLLFLSKLQIVVINYV
jgi:hypothetical protein